MHILLLLSLAGLSMAKAEKSKSKKFEKSEGIFVLTDKNYEAAVKEFDYLLVYFYAPWCGHCKALGPEFVKAGQMLKEKDSVIKLGKVDGTEEEELMNKHNVTGYPTLKLYRKKQLVPYTGGRMAPEIVDWLEKKIGPPAQPLDSLKDVKSFVGAKDVTVVGFFEEKGEEFEKYNLACQDYDDYGVHYPVGVTTEKEALEHYEVKNKIVLFKKFDEKKVVYDGEMETQAIRDFITENSLPVVIEFNHENAQKMFKRPNNQKSHLLVFHNKTEDTFDEEMKMLAGVGREFKEQCLFTSVDVNEEDHRRMLEFLGVRHRINNDTFPTMRIVTMKDDQPPIRFKPEDTTVSEDNVRTFVKSYLDGKIDREYFTEPLPKDWDSQPSKYLTAINFKSLVMEEPKKPSLIMWYAPWCGHCKNMMPVWNEMGEKFEDFLVGKIDATVNEVPGLPAVHTFPTIKLYRTDGTEAEYNGERTVEGLSKFLKTDGVYGMAAPDDPPTPKKDEL